MCAEMAAVQAGPLDCCSSCKSPAAGNATWPGLQGQFACFAWQYFDLKDQGLSRAGFRAAVAFRHCDRKPRARCRPLCAQDKCTPAFIGVNDRRDSDKLPRQRASSPLPSAGRSARVFPRVYTTSVSSLSPKGFVPALDAGFFSPASGAAWRGCVGRIRRERRRRTKVLPGSGRLHSGIQITSSSPQTFALRALSSALSIGMSSTRLMSAQDLQSMALHKEAIRLIQVNDQGPHTLRFP